MSKVGKIYAPEIPVSMPKHSQWLLGQGAGTWFCIDQTATQNQYNIKRYTSEGTLDCDRIFEVEENDLVFDINQTYQFVHISHCAKCRIEQNSRIYIFNYLEQ